MNSHSIDQLCATDLRTHQRHIKHDVISRARLAVCCRRHLEVTQASVVLWKDTVDKVDCRSTQHLHQSILNNTHSTVGNSCLLLLPFMSVGTAVFSAPQNFEPNRRICRFAIEMSPAAENF